MVLSWFGASHQWSLLSWLVYHEKSDTNRWFRGTSISGNHHFRYLSANSDQLSSLLQWLDPSRLTLSLQPPFPKESGPWWQLGSLVFNPLTWAKQCHKPVCFFCFTWARVVARCFGALHLQTRLFASSMCNWCNWSNGQSQALLVGLVVSCCQHLSALLTVAVLFTVA